MRGGKSIVLHDYFESAEGGGRLSLTLAAAIGADLAYGFKVRGINILKMDSPAKNSQFHRKQNFLFFFDT